MALTLKEQTAASVTTPATSEDSLYIDSTSGALAQKDDAGAVQTIGPAFKDAGNSSTAQTFDWSAAQVQKSTLTGNVTYTFSNPVAGGVYVLHVVQGSGPYTTTWPASVKWAAGTAPTLTATNAKRDIFTFSYDGTNYYGVTSGQNY